MSESNAEVEIVEATAESSEQPVANVDSDGTEEGNSSDDANAEESDDDDDDGAEGSDNEKSESGSPDAKIPRLAIKNDLTKQFCMFPRSSIKNAIDASFSHVPINEECLILVNKTVELFIEYYTKQCTAKAKKNNRNTVEYEDLYTVVREDKPASDLRQSIPRRRPFSQVKGLIMHDDDDE